MYPNHINLKPSNPITIMPKSNSNPDELSPISEQLKKMYGDDDYENETAKERFARHLEVFQSWIDKQEHRMTQMEEPAMSDVYIRTTSAAPGYVIPGPGFLAVLDKDVPKDNPNE